tara:strand:- start:160 stop:468 length:309 start_codon:yes stop_codon:yes gene_type:complete
MYAPHATVKMTTFQHEDFLLDLTQSSKAKLYKNNKLMFLGDGYRAITILIRSCKHPGPVEQKFKPQLTQSEQPRFTAKQDNLEEIKRQAMLDNETSKKKKKK